MTFLTTNSSILNNTKVHSPTWPIWCKKIAKKGKLTSVSDHSPMPMPSWQQKISMLLSMTVESHNKLDNPRTVSHDSKCQQLNHSWQQESLLELHLLTVTVHNETFLSICIIRCHPFQLCQSNHHSWLQSVTCKKRQLASHDDSLVLHRCARLKSWQTLAATGIIWALVSAQWRFHNFPMTMTEDQTVTLSLMKQHGLTIERERKRKHQNQHSDWTWPTCFHTHQQNSWKDQGCAQRAPHCVCVCRCVNWKEHALVRCVVDKLQDEFVAVEPEPHNNAWHWNLTNVDSGDCMTVKVIDHIVAVVDEIGGKRRQLLSTKPTTFSPSVANLTLDKPKDWSAKERLVFCFFNWKNANDKLINDPKEINDSPHRGFGRETQACKSLLVCGSCSILHSFLCLMLWSFHAGHELGPTSPHQESDEWEHKKQGQENRCCHHEKLKVENMNTLLPQSQHWRSRQRHMDAGALSALSSLPLFTIFFVKNARTCKPLLYR